MMKGVGEGRGGRGRGALPIMPYIRRLRPKALFARCKFIGKGRNGISLVEVYEKERKSVR